MSNKPAKGLHYFNTGPWPVYIGFTTSPKSFAVEMKRLSIKDDIPFVATEHAHASTHYFRSPGGTLTCIITMPDFNKKKRSREQYAALIAHEAMHVIQEMQDELAQGKRLGSEAEAYLIQQIVQECLQVAWKTGNTRQMEPSA